MASRKTNLDRRVLAIKSADGKPLTRQDIQYDVLRFIFDDKHTVFTNPYSPGIASSDSAKLTFRDLYINAILNSPKAPKNLKDKMKESSQFSEDFAMLALLVNLGRVNTTMSFFPEMKTAVRTYHPIPCLQRTNNNLLDAPRIKNILKASLLENEIGHPPNALAEIVARVTEGHSPSTSLPNLIFVFANQLSLIDQNYLNKQIGFNGLFQPSHFSSSTRGKTFLWLCYNYLEKLSSSDENYDGDMDSVSNPFSDTGRPGLPDLDMLPDAVLENVDTEAEKAIADTLVSQRNHILEKQAAKDNEKDADSLLDKRSASISVKEDDEDQTVNTTIKGKAGSSDKAKKEKRSLSTASKEKKCTGKMRRELNKKINKDLSTAGIKGSDYILNARVGASFQGQPLPPLRHQEYGSGPTRNTSSQRRYEPYGPVPAHGISSLVNGSYHAASPPRSMLEHAWHVTTTRDPLLDFDEKSGNNHDRWDYIQRLRVITRLRGQPPTPEPEQSIPHASTTSSARVIRAPV